MSNDQQDRPRAQRGSHRSVGECDNSNSMPAQAVDSAPRQGASRTIHGSRAMPPPDGDCERARHDGRCLRDREQEKERKRACVFLSIQDVIFLFLDYLDRKSTRLNSSHKPISYAVFCLKKKKQTKTTILCLVNMTDIKCVY